MYINHVKKCQAKKNQSLQRPHRFAEQCEWKFWKDRG